MEENLDTEILDRAMWNMYQTMKDDNFQFDGYSHEDKVMMVNHILPYFEKIGEYEVCKVLHNNLKDPSPDQSQEGSAMHNKKNPES